MNKLNFESYPIGSKIQVLDAYGYGVREICGIIVSHLGDGHAVISNFDGDYFSTVGIHRAYEIETLN
jgi:hypothetical protein